MTASDLSRHISRKQFAVDIKEAEHCLACEGLIVSDEQKADAWRVYNGELSFEELTQRYVAQLKSEMTSEDCARAEKYCSFRIKTDQQRTKL